MTTTMDPAALAAHARSLLSCPLSVSMLVDGVELVLGEDVSMREDDGTPTFFAPIGSTLDLAAEEQRNALLRISGQLEAPHRESADSLVLAGRLHPRGVCARDEQTRIITFEVRLASLVRPATGQRPECHLPVSLTQFAHPSHRLNRGYLLSCTRHVNACHQDELLEVVSRTTGTRVGDLAGAALARLDSHGVELSWVDVTGAHAREIRFPRPAFTPEELAAMLSTQLHAHLC